MPYGPSDTPSRLKGKGIPRNFIRQYNHVFNSTLKKTGDEGRAHAAAYSTMSRSLRKAGYRKDSKGVWHKGRTKEAGDVSDSTERQFQKNVGGGVDRDKLPDSAFVFPRERKFPIVIPKDVSDAVRSWGRYRGKRSFADFKRNLTRKARSKGPKFVARLPKEWKKKKEGAEPMDILIEGLPHIEKIVEGEDGRLRYKAIVLRDNAVSANRRFYSENANDRIMEMTNAWQGKGNVITIYSRHGKALGGFLSLPTGIPIGRADGALFREGNEICYNGLISPTSEGKDVARLIQDDVMKPNSLRAYHFKAKPMKMHIKDEELEVMAVQEAIIAGIDFCERAGISGAGIVKILEEAPELYEGETEMDWNEVTLEELTEERPDLLNAHVVEVVGSLMTERDELKAKVEELEGADPVPDPELQAKVEELTTQAEALTAKIGETEKELGLFKAAATPVVAQVVEDLKAADITPEELPKKAKDIREAAITKILAEAATPAEGHTRGTDEPDVGDPGYAEMKARKDLPEELGEEVDELLRMSSIRTPGGLPVVEPAE